MVKLIKENDATQLKDIELFKQISDLCARKAKGESSIQLNKELRQLMSVADGRMKDMTTASVEMLEDLKDLGFRKFTKEDFYGWDMEKCSDGSMPLINEMEDITSALDAIIALNDEFLVIEFDYDDGDHHEFSIECNGVDDAVRKAKVSLNVVKSSDSFEECANILKNKGFIRNS